MDKKRCKIRKDNLANNFESLLSGDSIHGRIVELDVVADYIIISKDKDAPRDFYVLHPTKVEHQQCGHFKIRHENGREEDRFESYVEDLESLLQCVKSDESKRQLLLQFL